MDTFQPESLKQAATNALDQRIAAARAKGIRTYVAEIGLLVSDLAYPDGAFVAPTIDDLPPAIRRAAEAMAREFYSRVAIIHRAVDLFGECLSHY